MNISKIPNLLLLCCCGLNLMSVTVYAQPPVLASDNPDVQIFPSSNSQHEVHISVNKTNGLNLIVSANTFINNSVSQGYYYSFDGGVTWFGSDNLPNSGVARGDPSTSFDASGRGYITTLTNLVDGYLVQHTDDQGLTWSAQQRGAGPTSSYGFDKEMITTVDELQTSPYANNFYCSWTDFEDNSLVKINRSTDGTSTFSNEVTLSNNWGQGTNVQTGPEGEVYVCWADYSGGVLPADNIGFAFSNDGGLSYSSSNAFNYLGIRTTNSGNSNFGNTRVNDFPAMAVDKSCGTNRGRIYITYPEFENSNSSKSVIRVRFSDNHGATWSNFSTISIPNGRQNWFPWIAVDDLTGLVNVIYFSFDSSDPNSNQTNTYVAYSSDGGSNWDNIRVSDQSHITSTIGASGYAGDYIGITSFKGRSYAAWHDNRNGNWQVYVSEIDYNLSSTISSLSNLSINAPGILSGSITYQAFQSIIVSDLNQVTIDPSANIEMVAGEEILFFPGFRVENEANFSARIDDVSPCSTPGSQTFRHTETSVSGNTIAEHNIARDTLAFAYPNPSSDFITVGCLNTNNSTKAFVTLLDHLGNTISKQSADRVDRNQIRHIINVSNLSAGAYIVTIETDSNFFSMKIIKSHE